MRTYELLKSDNPEVLNNTKKRLMKERGNICIGCLQKRREINLDVYQVDSQGKSVDSNWVLLDKACHKSILSIINALFGKSMIDFDYRAGEGKLNIVAQ